VPALHIWKLMTMARQAALCLLSPAHGLFGVEDPVRDYECSQGDGMIRWSGPPSQFGAAPLVR